MALIDLRCLDASCENIFEAVRLLADAGDRVLGIAPTNPPCPDCGGPTEQVHLAPARRAQPDPVVVYLTPDGSYRYPGDANGLTARNYDRQGYQRLELRGHQDVQRVMRDASAKDRARVAERLERNQAQREHREKHMRSELFHRMGSMSNLGRDLARRAISLNNAKATPKVYDPGLHVEVYENDRSNRDESRDERGRRRRD